MLIKDLLQQFDNFAISHAYREANGAADNLANFAVSQEMDITDSADLDSWPCLHQIIEAEKAPRGSCAIAEGGT
ncbi:hypothetical protein SUGI_0026070 [Cryptomeria japonica]|nr:hypothetical protein SUGI_0026070 [Cryptomeria japonica]